MKKLAVIITHPIQYYAPLFKLLNERGSNNIKVFYTWEQSKEKVFDKKFGKEIKWDIPLLYGYEYTFVKNTSKNPGSGNFKGVINPSLIKEIEDWNANAVLIFGWNHHSHFKAMRYFKGKIPVYFRGDSTLVDVLPPIRKLLRRIALTFIYKFTDYAFYVGTNNKAYYKKYGLKEKQLIFAPHATDNDRFGDLIYSEKALVVKKELAYTENDIVCLFAGKFEPVKNPLLLIDAAINLPDIQFLFVGNGELEEKMKEKAAKLNNVRFLPFQNQSQMPVIYNCCDIFILPSKGRGETWGLAVNEAMACGKAVIVSDRVGCAVDLVKENKNGYIFKSENLSDLNKKIKSIKNKYLSFGEASRKIIQNWDFNSIVESIEQQLINETI